MASGELSLTSTSSQEFDCFPATSGGSGGSVGGVSGGGPGADRSSNSSRMPTTDSPKDFESAKQLYDQAVIELTSLRVQHSERKCRMDHVMEQLEFYREQYMAAMNQVEQSAQEGSNLRTKYTDISNENVRLQQRNHHLEKKLTRCMETIKQEKEHGGATNAYTFVEQCNEWKKKYDTSLLEMEAMRKEMDRYKKVCEDLSRDRNSLALEKDSLKQQLSNSIREKGMFHDDIKEMTKVMQSRADELRRVTAQRNAAEHELRTILAERKGVLEENQKLSDDLSATKDELENHIREEKKTAYENDSLKLEIESVLRYRDDLAKECGNLREKLDEANQKMDHRDMLMKSRDSTWSKDMLSDSKDKFGRSEQHILDLDVANQEIEKLRKSLERAMTDIDKSANETEVAKSRRDWAISEREKIVLERDSVKILCDELRKERDTAISDLLAAIRDSEKIKKQKDEACREVEQIREQLDSQLLNSSRRNIRWSCSPYELDMFQKNDTEIVELDMSAASGSDADFGIVLEGGREDSLNRGETGVVVVSVAVDSIAYGMLRPNDCILQINSLDCKTASKRMVHEALRTCGSSRCSIVVKRQKVNKSHMYAVQLNMTGGNRNHGITLETGVFISKIASDSLAAKEGELLAGDRVLSVNSKTMEGVKTAKEAMAHLDDNRTDSLTIISLKQVTQARDVVNTTRSKHSKMTNTCTQTEGGNGPFANSDASRSFASTQNSKSTSKISEMINKFKGKMHIPGHGQHKGSTVSETDSWCLENDAIEVLDSVLNNENASGKSKDNLFKRSKRSSKKEINSSLKEANKNLGTWPRTNILLSSTAEGNHSGTIVQPRKKERPTLSFFTGPISLSKEEKAPPPIKKDNYFQPGVITAPNTTSGANSGLSQNTSTNSNRNSNPIPFHVLCPPPPSVVNRHSVYGTTEIDPIMPSHNSRTAPVPMPHTTSHTLSRNSKIQGMYHHSNHYHPINPNRLSLNIPTNTNILDSNHLYNTLHSSSRSSHNKSPAMHPDHPQKLISPSSSTAGTQKNSLDHIPFKNSIDSFLNPKSNMSSMDFKRTSMTSPQQLKDTQHSLKSQNSIDSFLQMPAKSPPSMDIPIKQSQAQASRDSFDVFTGNRGDPNASRSSRNNSKYPSDSDSLGMMDLMPVPSSGLPSTSSSYTSPLPTYTPPSRMQSVPPSSRAHRSGYPSIGGLPVYLHPHSHPIRQSSPLTLPVSQAPFESSAQHSTDKLEFEYSLPHHSHGASMDVDMYSGRVKQSIPSRGGQPDRDMAYSGGSGSGYYGHHAYEGGTFPRKKENQRFRIPSNPSVTSKGSGVKNSTGSIEHGSERGSPMPPAFQVEVLSHGANKRNSMPDYCYGQKPSPGDLRRVTIDKSVELGITITCNTGGGIFVSTVAENSIASQVGLQIGDQLLEVCGINMRNATYDLAANVLRQCGNSITMLVQYSPDKFDRNARPPRSSEDDIVSRSGSPTPRNSPRTTRAILMSGLNSNKSTTTPSQSTATHSSTLPPPTTAIKNQKFADSLENQSSSDLSQPGSPNASTALYESEPRLITMTTKKNTNLGISLMGGNAVGIYVHDVQKSSLADNAGMRKGDQILEYNGTNLTRVTAEQAANEISKPVEKVTIVVQHNLKKFNQIKDEAGDSLYIRVGFDRTGDLGEGELRFTKDDVLYVDTTIFRGVFGQWRAWKLDEYGHRLECGIIPSQLKVEEELRLLSDITDGDGTTRRGSTSARRSFFRRKKHPRSSSRDSKEVASFSNTQLSWFSDSGMLSEEGTIPSYQRVERLDYSVCRPVLIIGPLAECVADKLSIDFPQLFQRCMMTPMNCSSDAMEKGLENNIFVDYRKRGSIFECTTVQAIRDICDKNRHCILDVCLSAVDRLQRMQIYPIVLLLRFKSAKQIKEIKDSRYSTDKISAKAAKEMYEHTQKLEFDYRQYISAVIPAGVNITHMSTQIKAAVDEEQTKVLWVPMSTQ